MFSLREILISLKKIFPFFLLFTSHIVNSPVAAQEKVIAYYTGNGENIRQFPLKKLTHVIYSFLHLSHDSLRCKNENQQETLRELVALKKDFPHLKVMVSLGGWGGCASCSAVFSSEKQRNNFAKTTVALFEKYGIDGLDLDWEYPAIEGYPGHAYAAADKENFTALVKSLRKAMGKKYILSFAAGGFMQYLENAIDWAAVMPEVDFVNLMTYDLVNGYSKVTGHHTPLYDYKPQQESTRKCVNWLLARGVPSAKLIIGAAFYARVWEDVLPMHNGLYQAGKFKTGVPFKNFTTYFSDSAGFQYHWDKQARAPYQYSARKKLFATFDNRRSIRAKVHFVQSKKLGGIMFWELSLDLPENGLVDEIYSALHQ